MPSLLLEAREMLKFFLPILMLVLFNPVLTYACTIFAAQGACVENDGTLIAKVRDFQPGPQELRLNAKGKYAFYGLYGGSDRERLSCRGGVNEEGLVVVNAMTSCIPKKQRLSYPSKPTIRLLLQNCASVAEALEHKEWFYGTKFLLIGDRKEIALIEIGAEGNTSISRAKNNYLAHTNFYLDPQFANLNIRVGASSAARYKRITELLETAEKPLSLQQFIDFTQDQNAGPDNSIWRLGSRPNVSESLAAFVVKITPDSDFKLWLKYRPEVEDKGNERIIELTREDIFMN